MLKARRMGAVHTLLGAGSFERPSIGRGIYCSCNRPGRSRSVTRNLAGHGAEARVDRTVAGEEREAAAPASFRAARGRRAGPDTGLLRSETSSVVVSDTAGETGLQPMPTAGLYALPEKHKIRLFNITMMLNTRKKAGK